MRKYLSIMIAATALTAASSINADWSEHWIRAVQLKSQGDFEECENEFKKALVYIDADPEEKHMHVHTDLAILYFDQQRYYEALEHTNIALDAPTVIRKDRIDALKVRSLTYIILDMKFRGQADAIEYTALDPNMPLFDFYDEYLVIRHCPQSKSEMDALIWLFTGSKICEKEDVKFYENNICIMKLRKKTCTGSECACICDMPVEKGHPMKDSQIKPQGYVDEQLEKQKAGCRWYCDRSFDSSIAFAAKIKARFTPWQLICLALAALKEKCYECCDGNGGFYAQCIEPIVKFCDTWQDW